MKYSIEDIRESTKKTIDFLLLEKAAPSGKAKPKANAQPQLMVPNPQWMADVFADYNKVAFGGFLKTPKFSTECESDEWGCYYPGSGKFGITNRFTMKNPGTLCLNGRLKRTKEEWIGVMLHEMCHIYVYQNGFSKYKDAHGPEFMQIAKTVNAKVKKYGVQVLVVDDGDVIEADGNEEYAQYVGTNGKASKQQNYQGGQIAICVITSKNEEDKYWICPLKPNEIKIAQAAVKKSKGVTSCKFYMVFSDKLTRAKTSPQTLAGFGGSTYNDAVVNFCSYYGEWDYKKLNVNNMKPIQ